MEKEKTKTSTCFLIIESHEEETVFAGSLEYIIEDTSKIERILKKNELQPENKINELMNQIDELTTLTYTKMHEFTLISVNLH